jgi:hypothetical protein
MKLGHSGCGEIEILAALFSVASYLAIVPTDMNGREISGTGQ